MPKSAKRKRSRSPSSEDLKSLAKKLKRYLDSVDSVEDSPERQHTEEEPRRRRRIRVLESSSRESSPSSKNNQDEENVESQDVDDTRPQETSSSNNNHENVLADILEAGTSTAAVQNAPLDAGVALNDAPAENSLDDAVLEILGDDPTSTVEYGKEIHKELANRFEHLATTGLTKELRKELCEKYLVPSNCTRVGAPQLNAEIKAALNESLVKRDKAIEARQKQIASAISCVAQIATDQLLSKDTNHDVLKKAMDAGRLLSDIQYAESTTRRNFATFSLKKEMKEHLFNTKIDKYLFGASLPDALKTAKAVTKSGTDLKVEAKKNVRTAAAAKSKPAAKNLNWKPQAPARRQPEPSRTREPAAPRSQPGTASKPSSRPMRRR